MIIHPSSNLTNWKQSKIYILQYFRRNTVKKWIYILINILMMWFFIGSTISDFESKSESSLYEIEPCSKLFKIEPSWCSWNYCRNNFIKSSVLDFYLSDNIRNTCIIFSSISICTFQENYYLLIFSCSFFKKWSRAMVWVVEDILINRNSVEFSPVWQNLV